MLATNFYTHFGLNSANLDEYDTDIMLEYEESETYKEFKEFFYDVLSEFEKFGKVVQFKVSQDLIKLNVHDFNTFILTQSNYVYQNLNIYQ